MESSVDHEPDEHAKPKSSSLSPKVARPKLPTFPPNLRSSKSRPKTDPGHGGEISRAVLEDIMKLKEVNYAKYSRLRPSRSQPSKVPQTTTSTPTSPVTGSSSPDNPKSGFSRRQSRSLKLTELTDKLKSGRVSNDTSCNIPPLSDLSTATHYGTLRKMRNIEDFSQCDETLDSPDNGPEDAGVAQASEDLQKATSSADDEEAEDLSSQEEFKDSTSEICSGKMEGSTHSSDCLPSPDTEKSFTDDGQSTSESDTSSTTSGPYIYQRLTRDSEFFKLAKTAPQRRTGITTLATRGRVQAMFGTSYPSRLAGFQQMDDQDELASGGQRRYPRRTESVIVSSSGQRKTDRFITHPPHRKTTFKEEGSIDSNGFGSIKSEELQEETTSDQSGDSIPVLAAGSIPSSDSQTGPSELRDYTDLQGQQNLVAEVSESERFEKKNGKSTKQKSISDPSADKTKAASDIAKEINSSHAHSSPILSRELESGGPLPQFQESDNFNSEQKLHSELILHQASPKFSTPERRISQESQRCQSPGIDTTIEEGDETDQSAMYMSDSLLKPEKPVYIGSSAPTTPQNQSPTSTLERAPHNLLSVPVPRKPIHRSMSSASVLQRDRRLLWAGDRDNKDKDVVRKYSINSDDSIPGNINSGTSVPEFAASLGDNGGYLTTSMPDVWKQNTTLFDSPERAQAYAKDQRYHIVQELYQNEQEYVDALKTLKEKYMIPLKTQRNLDENTVGVIFHMIPEILTHHSIYLNFLDSVWENWDSKISTVGNIIISCFSKQTVLDSYLSFVENYEKSGSVLENDLLTKSSVSKFIEQCQKDSGSKLSMKDLIVRPIQRIPRYELLIQRLAENTPKDHPDYPMLTQAEKVMHDMALKIGSVSNSQQEEGQHETLKKLELLLITDLAAPDRTYLRHDMVQIMSKKDQCCIWMFSDLIIISSTKRKSGPVTRKVSIILQSPSGLDFAENMKHKICLRVGLDDIEVLKDPSSLSRRSTIEKEQIEDDLTLLGQISDITTRLNCTKQTLEEVIRDIGMNLNKQLTEHQNRIHSADANKLELQITTQEKVFNLIVVFVSPEKRLSWETSFLDAKHKLSLLSDKRAPEFLQPLQITKTRAGMQFSCAAPIDGVNANGYREVWVCNSDGYVGHMCLLSLQPEPIVTLNTPVPGCNARILCICAVPAFSGSRRSSVKNRRNRTTDTGSTGSTVVSCGERPRINIESVDTCMESIGEDAGSPSDSESSDDDAYTMPHQMEPEELCLEDEEAPSSPTAGNQDNNDQNTTRWMHDTMKSTMWLGTEDGCIHIFLCTDNIKTTKNKLKIQHGAPVYCIIYLDNKVFVSLANGDLIVYRRDLDGQWDTEHPYTRTLGSATCPISKMHAVAGKLWCGSQNNICIVNPLTLKIEHQFVVNPDASRCVQCIVSSGQGVWVAPQQSSKVNLYHATTYEFLHEINITPAVTQKLQSADDIIRQHKTACLRVTALLICKDLLWVGTSAGVILTIPVPKITSTTTRSTINCPTVTGLVYGHTGHVRFLTSVELPNNTAQKSDPNNISGIGTTAAAGGSSGTTTTTTSSSNNNDSNNNNGSSTNSQQQQIQQQHHQQQFQTQGAVSGNEGNNNGSSLLQEGSGSPPPEGNLSPQEIQRRSSMATTATMATRMLVISGGDGYEDFRNNVANEAAGRDDSTNHLLLWQV